MPKNGSLNRDLLKFLNRYGIFWVPPGESSCPDGSEYVWQRGVESLQGRVTAARSWPLFRAKKKNLKRCSPKPYGHNFHISALSLNQRYFDIYEISLIQFQGWNMKIVAERFWETPTYFCWQLAFHRHLPTSGRQNTVKTAPQPLIVNSAFVALYVGIILPIGPTPISLFVFDLEAED